MNNRIKRNGIPDQLPGNLPSETLHISLDNHTQIQQWMAIYDHLTVAQRAEVDAHLAACSTCAQIFQRDQLLAGELHALIEQRQQQLNAQPQAQLHHARARFQQKVRQTQWGRPFANTVGGRRPQQRWLTVAATLLLLLFLGTGVGQIWGGISLLIPVYATGTPQSKPTPTPTVTATPQLGIASPTPQVGARQTDMPFADSPPEAMPYNLMTVYSSIESALQREVEVWGAQEAASFDRYIDPTAAQEWRITARSSAKSLASWMTRPTIELLHMQILTDELALVQLEMNARNVVNPIQVGRVYRYMPQEDRWYWSQPPMELWGEAQTIETAHLRFDYQARDAEAIAAVAPLLEDAYVKLHETLGVEIDVERAPQDFYYDKKLTLKIVPEEMIARREPGFTYSFSAPGLVGWHHSWPRTSMTLHQSYAAALLTQLSLEVIDKAQDKNSFPSRGFAEVENAMMRWLVNDSLEYGAYRRLDEASASQLLINRAELQLNDLVVSPTGPNAYFGKGELTLASTALIDYVVAHYGREAIPTLIRALVGNADTWEKLIPATFGLSLTEFEQNWNAWLLKRYPIAQSSLAMRSAIEESLALEFAAREAMSASLADGYLDPEMNANWRAEHLRSLVGNGDPSIALRWFDYEIVEIKAAPGSDIAQVRVSLTINREIQPEVIEGRFYRRVAQAGGEDRWLLTSPNESMLGEVLTLETDHFYIQYHELDAPIVEAAATQLEAGYSKMLRTLALPESRDSRQYNTYQDGKFHIKIVPERVTSWSPRESSYRFTSPFFFAFPKSDDESTLLAASILGQIVHPIMSYEIYLISSNNWIGSIQAGLNLWIIEDSLPRPTFSLSPYMGELAATFHQRIGESSTPITLDRLLTLSQTTEGYMAGMLLLDYIAAIHGRDEIPRFLHGLNEYEGWEELIPSIFGVEVAQFEAGFDVWVRAEANRTNAQ